jgi:hypothetical protein
MITAGLIVLGLLAAIAFMAVWTPVRWIAAPFEASESPITAASSTLSALIR